MNKPLSGLLVYWRIMPSAKRFVRKMKLPEKRSFEGNCEILRGLHKYKNNKDDWEVTAYFVRISEIVIQLSSFIILHNLMNIFI